jgi:hypothetical protein
LLLKFVFVAKNECKQKTLWAALVLKNGAKKSPDQKDRANL